MESQNTAFELGRQHAEIFLGFSCFQREQSRREEINTLCFCTREGVFFKALFDTLFGGAPDSEPLVKTRLLEVSRLSTFAPSLLRGQSLDLTRLYRLYPKQSPNSLLASLGQDPKDYQDLLQERGLEPGKKIKKAASDPGLNGLLEDPRFVERLYPQLEQQNTTIQHYLAQHFADTRKIGFVEIGWRGTIQNSIAKLVPDRTFHGMYLGLALERDEMNANCRRVAYGPDRNLGIDDRDLLDAINVLEFICLSNGGSAEGYDANADGSVTARMRHVAEEDRCVEEFSLPFQQGVLAVAGDTDIDALIREHESGSLRVRAMEQWRDLLKRPDRSLVRNYFSLKSNEQFGHGSVSDQSVVPSFTTVVLAPFNKSRRQELITYLTHSQWAQGMFHRKDLALPTKLLFYLLMKVALGYKVILHLAKSRARSA